MNCFCDASLQNGQELCHHLQTVHNLSSHACSICNIEFVSARLLQKHNERVHHSVARNFKCFICFRSFNSQSLRDTHVLICRRWAASSQSGGSSSFQSNDFTLKNASLGGGIKPYEYFFKVDCVDMGKVSEILLKHGSQLISREVDRMEQIKVNILLHVVYYKSIDPESITIPPVILKSQPFEFFFDSLYC